MAHTCFSDFSKSLPETELKLPLRRIPNQNVVIKLRRRESNRTRFGAVWNSTRHFCQSVFPNFTVSNVEKPPFYLRKFSPDGKYFIVFSADQTSVEVYEFQGCHAAENLLSSLDKYPVDNVLHEHLSPNVEFKKDYQNIREKLFSKFFVLKHLIPVASEGQNLNRECSLFAEDGQHVLVLSAAFLSNDGQTPFYDIYTNNEAMSPNQRFPLEDYSLHSVDYINGILQCSVNFKCDKIFPSHNQGLYLYKSVLAVLSVQHQTVHIFHLKDGALVKTHTIGRFCFDDDFFVFQRLHSTLPVEMRREPFHEITINSLKHRILVFLFKKASAEGKDSLMRFYQQFSFLKDLRLWRMQLLDEEHLLLKYASQDVVGLRVQDSNAQPSFFVVFNFNQAKVLAVYENTSMHLLRIFEQNPGLFRSADVIQGHLQAACSDIYSNQLQQRFKETIINAKYGGHMEAVKRLLAQLPMSSQSYSPSPYLDLSLFSYDDKWISQVERPRSSGDYPIKFYARNSGLLKFEIRTGMISGSQSSSRKLVAFTFHPTEPFAISVQRMNTDYVFNFHFRHVPRGTK